MSAARPRTVAATGTGRANHLRPGPLSWSVARARPADGGLWRAGMEGRAAAGLPAPQPARRGVDRAEAYLAGMNTRRVRRVRRALATPCEGRIGQDGVGRRARRKTRSAWQARRERDLAGDGIVRLILAGTVVEARSDRQATAVSLPSALGVRRDGQEVVLAIESMGGEREAACGGPCWTT